MPEAIILAGGDSMRMRPEWKWSKALLMFGRYPLLDIQIFWLQEHGFDHIVVATDERTYRLWSIISKATGDIDVSLEWKKLGTSGAVLRAGDYISDRKVYVMNVDDILRQYSPMELYNSLERGGIVALHKPKIGYGLARVKNGLVTRFQEKPTIKYWVSCGHYVFRRDIIRDYFTLEGDLEREVLPVLAKERQLQGYKVRTPWITINTYKDYLETIKTLRFKSSQNLL